MAVPIYHSKRSKVAQNRSKILKILKNGSNVRISASYLVFRTIFRSIFQYLESWWPINISIYCPYLESLLSIFHIHPQRAVKPYFSRSLNTAQWGTYTMGFLFVQQLFCNILCFVAGLYQGYIYLMIQLLIQLQQQKVMYLMQQQYKIYVKNNMQLLQKMKLFNKLQYKHLKIYKKE